MNAVIRAYDAVVDDVNKSDRSLVARINTAGVDRYKTVIDPRGGKLENYRKNPAVLWEHGKDPRRFTDPIGRNVWIKHNGGERPSNLLARTKFLDDDFSQQRFEWYRDSTLNAFSVNILPVAERCSPPTKEELRASPDWEPAQLVYREWDLAEYSGTTIPGNADCLVSERACRMAELVNRGLLWFPDEVIPLIARYITHSDGKWIVHAESGKVLGEHDSKEDAEKQLAAVEAHKHDDRGASPGKTPPSPRAAPYVETDGRIWTVYDPDGRAVAMYPDGGLAEESRQLMATSMPGGFERTLVRLMVEQRAANERLFEDMVARIELKIFGRV